MTQLPFSDARPAGDPAFRPIALGSDVPGDTEGREPAADIPLFDHGSTAGAA